MKRGLTLILIAFLFITLILPTIYAADSPDDTLEKESILKKEISLSTFWESIIKGVFKVEGTLTISLLVLMTIIWLILVKILIDALELTPFFEGAIGGDLFKLSTAFIASIIIATIIAATGVISQVALFILDLKTLYMILGFIAIIIIATIISKLIATFRGIENKAKITSAEMQGQKTGMALWMSKAKNLFR
tara:strand:- start:4316 stop:4891 length:576 start_codon:yes stop_codon:yes gene_type:complete